MAGAACLARHALNAQPSLIQAPVKPRPKQGQAPRTSPELLIVESTRNSSGAGAPASSARAATRSSSSTSSRKRLMVSSPRSRYLGG
jgi:hypothetical protein